MCVGVDIGVGVGVSVEVLGCSADVGVGVVWMWLECRCGCGCASSEDVSCLQYTHCMHMSIQYANWHGHWETGSETKGSIRPW